MLSQPTSASIYLCVQPVDLRKSFDGLGGLVETVFRRSLLDGHLFLFLNKRCDRLKALWWDQDGLVIWYKRLERGSFEMPRFSEGDADLVLDATDLAMLLGGVSLATARRRKRYARAS